MALTTTQIKEIARYALPIICGNEGTYGSVNRNDNGAVSIGKLQWHGNRALGLLKTICTANALQAIALLGSLYGEIIKPVVDWSSRTATSAEATAITSLLTTSAGKAAQDALAEADITEYINKGIGYGLTDYGALIYFADGVNQYGTASPLWKSITQKALAGKGDAAAMLAATKALTVNHLVRREKVYSAVLALDLKGVIKNMTTTTNFALVEHAQRALAENWGYCLGGFGSVLTEAFLAEKCRQGGGVGAYNTKHRDYLRRFMGKRVTDCYGLVKSLLWWNGGDVKYNPTQDRNQEGAYNDAKEKGALATIPEIPGLVLWMKGHAGIYIGNGEFIECVGAPTGMRKGRIQNGTVVSGSKFTHWFMDTFITYPVVTASATNSTSAYTVKAGDSLWAIAVRYLGSGARYKEIMALNGLKSDVIRPGQVLTIPAK